MSDPVENLKDKVKVAYNAGFGYWFPEHIVYSGEHQDYYSKEFAELVVWAFNNIDKFRGEVGE